MTNQNEIFSADLAGVIVGETAISDVQGEAGILSYRGINITELVDKPFCEVVWLVVFGKWPNAQQSAQLLETMVANSSLSECELNLVRGLPKSLHPMLMLQGLVPLLNLPEEANLGLPLDAEQGLYIAAKISGLIAAQHRIENDKEPLTSGSQKSFHDNFLTLFHGEAPQSDDVRMLDAAQILQMEHSFNAGTFAGRVCASTQASIQSSISASIGTLYGRLHGGADQAALEMAMAIGSADAAADYIADTLAKGEKIMGMGHREYRTVDPRAKLLKPMAVKLCQNPDSKQLLATLVAIEEACQATFSARGKEIWANVEFYKGAVFHSLGIPTRNFTAMFAMARVYGYIAHFLEFKQGSRLIRPRARYIPAQGNQGAAA